MYTISIGVTDMKMIKKIAGGLLAVLLILIFGQCLYATAAWPNYLPVFLPVEGYAVPASSLGDLLPEGSLALVDPDAAMETGHIALYFEEKQVCFGIVHEAGVILSADEPNVIVNHDTVAGRVVYRINGLGTFFGLLTQHGIAVWVLCAALVVGCIAWAVTVPRRRRKKEVRELIELFDYYGRKYDAEEEGIEY